MRSALLQYLSHITLWANLKKLTESRVAKLTMLAPFVGYLVLYNAELRNLLQLTYSFDPISTVWLRWLRDHSFSILYFGLISFGSGVALFAVFAPKQISEYSSLEDFISRMEDIKTPNLVESYLRETISGFFANYEGEQRSPFFSYAALSFSGQAADSLRRLVEFLAGRSFDEETAVACQSGTGEWLTDEIMEMMGRTLRVERVYWMQLFAAAFSEASKEVFFVSYTAANSGYFFRRLTVGILCGVGVVLLLIPTVTTCLLMLGLG